MVIIISFVRCFRCPVFRKELQQAGLKDFKNIYKYEKNLSCSQCDLLFSGPRSLEVHMRKHTGEKPFKCSECNKAFSQTNNLTVHLQ